MKITTKSGFAFAALFLTAAFTPAVAQDSNSTGTGSQDPATMRRDAKQNRRAAKAEVRTLKAERREAKQARRDAKAGMRDNSMSGMQGGSMSGGMMSGSATAIGADFQATVDRAIATLDAMNRVIDGANARNAQLRQRTPGA